MVDVVNALQNPVTRYTERGEVQRDWIVPSAECARRAKEALTKAAEVLAEDVPGRRPDDELARALAASGSWGVRLCRTSRRPAAWQPRISRSTRWA